MIEITDMSLITTIIGQFLFIFNELPSPMTHYTSGDFCAFPHTHIQTKD